MKETFWNIVRCIVGCETGFTGEGNDHWYYFISLVINIMLSWWLNPKIALVFTILAVINYATIFIYGYFDLCDRNGKVGAILRYTYVAIHIASFVIAIITSWNWALITTGITVISMFLAPDDCGGYNIFLRNVTIHDRRPLLFHAIIFTAFVVIDFLLPIKLWIKIVILSAALIGHPIMDYLEGECCIEPIDETLEVLDEIKNRKGR